MEWRYCFIIRQLSFPGLIDTPGSEWKSRGLRQAVKLSTATSEEKDFGKLLRKKKCQNLKTLHA